MKLIESFCSKSITNQRYNTNIVYKVVLKKIKNGEFQINIVYESVWIQTKTNWLNIFPKIYASWILYNLIISYN